MAGRVFIIAEAGVNHNGDMRMAKKLIEAAKKCGADAVKFQSFMARTIALTSAAKAAYQLQTTDNNESQYDMLKKLELSEDMHRELISHCKKIGIMFLSSPFCIDGIRMLLRLGLDIIKVPSGEITNMPYLRVLGKARGKVMLSSGMSDFGEIGAALKILSVAGTPKKNIQVLHCNTEYPTPYKDVNLKAMPAIAKCFGVEVGYSDHTQGIEVAVAAVAIGAQVIEKHLTLANELEGPDHRASLEPADFKMMVNAIRNVEKALGSGVKKVSPSERRNKRLVRKGIKALVDIREGDTFSETNMTVLRPETGISPMLWDKVIGKTAKRMFHKGDPIEI